MTRHLHMNNVHPFPTFDRCDFAEPSVPRPDLYEQLCEAEYLQEDGRHSPLSPCGPSLKSRPIGFDRGRVVKAFCLAVAVFCLVYFPLRLLVAFL